MRSRLGSAALVLVLVIPFAASTIGCKAIARALLHKAEEKADSDDTTTLTKAPEPEWDKYNVKLRGTKAEGMFLLREAKLKISFHDLPDGTVLSAGGQKATASHGSANVSVDVSDKLAKLSPKDAFDSGYHFDPNVRATLDFGKGITLDLDAPSESISYSLGEMYKQVADAPISIASKSPPKSHTILFLGSLTPEPMGAAATLADIDLVAVETNMPERKGKTCSGYRKSKGGKSKGPEKDLTLHLIDQKITIYEAATSKEVASKVFQAQDRCPMMAFSGKANSYASTSEQKDWIREQRKKM